MDEFARTERIIERFEEALALTDVDRRAYLASVRSEDADIADELDSLLDSYRRAPDRLSELAARVFPGVVLDLSHALSAGSMSHRCIGRYRLLERLGSGGMGEVYRARDMVLDREVALKWVADHSADDPEARARLIREAKAASVLDHPGIAVIHEIGLARAPDGDDRGEQLFIAMACYDGETLEQKLARGPLAVAEAVDLAEQIADALACAHEAGVVHRDIKPANLIVTEHGRIRIVDFGLASTSIAARRERSTGIDGTLAYMSPEQTRGEGVDQRADIWSLGVVLYEMLTGRRPFEGDGERLIGAIREDPAPPMHGRAAIPAALAMIVEKCLAKNPADRYASANQMQTALRGISAVTRSVHADDTRRSRWQRVPILGALNVRPAVAVALLATTVVTSAGLVVAVRSAWSGSERRPGAASPGVIVILPFEPVAEGVGLENLSRDLVVTLSTTLEGIGGLRTVDALTVLAQREADSGRLSLDAARAMAERLGADRFLHGGLTLAGTGVRLDAFLYPVGEGDAIARVSVTAEAEDHTAFSDSVAIAFLDQLWRHDPPAVPSLPAIRQSSVPEARRAHLEGELALARADMPTAVASFERAFAADTTFWWAYWRSLYPRLFREARVPADTAVVRKVVGHRSELPEPDRFLVEIWTLESRSQALARLQELLSDFGEYSPGWWAYANLLVHYGPYLGHDLSDSRAALEQFLALDPDFATAWDHLRLGGGPSAGCHHCRACGGGDRTTDHRCRDEADLVERAAPARVGRAHTHD